jgi:hypothetical protein
VSHTSSSAPRSDSRLSWSGELIVPSQSFPFARFELNLFSVFVEIVSLYPVPYRFWFRVGSIFKLLPSNSTSSVSILERYFLRITMHVRVFEGFNP